MKNLLLLFVFGIFIFVTNCQVANTQEKSTSVKTNFTNPPEKAEVFEPNVISKFDRWSFTPTFSKDMKTLVFVGWSNPDLSISQSTIQKLYKSKKVDGKWTEPVEIEETKGFRVDWASFSPDGKYFLLSYTKPHEGHYKFPAEKDFNDFDIWIAPANENGDIDWKNFKPIKGADINRQKTPENKSIGYVHNETAPRMDLNGNLYFWTERLDDGGGRRDIYSASIKNLDKLEWDKAKIMPTPINSRFNESGAAISPNGNWMIFASERKDGLGESDLYFSKKINEKEWSNPVNLGSKVNTPKDEGAPHITPDGKALFFVSNRPIKGKSPIKNGEGGRTLWVIYWISVDSLDIID